MEEAEPRTSAYIGSDKQGYVRGKIPQFLTGQRKSYGKPLTHPATCYIIINRDVRILNQSPGSSI